IAFEFFDQTDRLKSICKRRSTLEKFLKKNSAQKKQITRKLLELESNKPFEYVYISKWTGRISDIQNAIEVGQKFDSGNFKIYFKSSHISFAKEAAKGSFVFTLEQNIQSTRWIWK